MGPETSREASAVIPLNRTRDAVEIGEEATFVDSDQVVLVANTRYVLRGNDVAGKCFAQLLRLEELVERLTCRGRECECRGLGDDAGVERRRFDHARERAAAAR